MNQLDILQLAITALVAIWGIYQTRVTKSLEQNIHLMNAGMNQTLQLLHRAREAVIKIHSTHVFLLELTKNNSNNLEIHAEKFGEMSAYQAELRGLAFAINDKDLLEIVNRSYDFMKQSPEERSIFLDEMEIRGRSQKLHTRIAELIGKTTRQKII